MKTPESFCESFVFNHFSVQKFSTAFSYTQSAFTCSKSRMETAEQYVKYVQNERLQNDVNELVLNSLL